MNGNPVTSPDAATPAQRLAALGLVLPSAPAAVGSYAGFVLAGNVLAISGQLSRTADGASGTISRSNRGKRRLERRPSTFLPRLRPRSAICPASGRLCA